MSLRTIVSLALPTLGLLVLSLWAPDGELSFLGGGYFAWFLVGSAFLIVSALFFQRRSPRTWKNGSILLWLAAACFMGGYSSLHLDKGRIGQLETAATTLQTTPADEAALTSWKDHGGEGRTADAAALDQIADDKGMLIVLEYVLAVLFVGSFYMIGVYASPEAQAEYEVLREELEDPLAFKAEFGIQ